MFLENMIKDVFKKLEDIENENYNAFNGYFFQLAVYLYCRYGEVPSEFGSGEELNKNLEKLLEVVRKHESLFNDNINEEAEDLIYNINLKQLEKEVLNNDE